MPALSVALTYSHQLLEERWTNSTPFVLTNQLIHQDSGTSNLQQLTSNPGPILPTPALWFQLSWGYLIIMQLIMAMLRFTLQIFHLNITLNLLQIQKTLRSNQLMIMKWTIYWNYSTHNMTMIFWMLTSRCFRLDRWSPLLKNFIQSLLCCFINMGEQMFLSKFSCQTFLY